ncbi:MAG: hypothetical protein A3F10_04410 [Coxiella sp. RIFCSPHIGHO2_12_FULL_42_15]|nr:MAG: hypothetical protein A3F10_04410 [Coxiella sp. RIFCSPHIGHO2_12_FULL_42_15]
MKNHFHRWYDKLTLAHNAKKIHQQFGPIFYQFVKNSDYIYWLRSCDFATQYFVNGAFEKLFGWTCQQLYENPILWLEAIVEHDRDRIQQEISNYLHCHDNKPRMLSYSIRNRTKEVIPVIDHVMPILNGKRCLGVMGMTAWAKAESVDEYDHHASEFFRYFIEKSDTVFWIKNLKNQEQIYINSAYEKVWGCSAESLKENPDSWYEVVHPDDKPHTSIHPLVEFDNDTEYKCSRRYRIVKPDGQMRWIHEKSYPVFDDVGEAVGCGGIAEDITEDVLREKELRQAKENAERANKAKSDFLAMMSHELRTPLNAILGMAQILERSKLNRDQEGQVEVITQAGNNLLSLLNDILDFTKLEVGKLKFTNENFELHSLINQLMTDMLPQAKKKNLTLTHMIDQDVARYLIGDSKRIQQILTNLLSNAIKYTKQGYVKLKITCLQRNNKETALCFTIEDSGIGIDKTKIDGIFRRFQQIESVYQRKHDGVGLGLAIVKELVERMGGSTTVSSELGVGSQFSCILPFVLQSTEMEPITAFLSESINVVSDPKFDLNVLVVEDNKINQKIARMMLEQIGCQVDVAENAEQALAMNYLKYDMIFMDLGLPDMDGFQATQQIRLHEGTGRRIPIVAMTAHIFLHDKERCFQVGMDEVVAKPIMRDDLIAVISRWAA